MGRLRSIFGFAFLAGPIMAVVIGYRYEGWLGALVFPIAAWALWGLALVGWLLVSTFAKHSRDRARVSHLSIEQLRLIVARPADADFRFAFAELATRGADMGQAQQSLIFMLGSRDRREREIGVERLREIHPQLRHVAEEPSEESPEEFRARVLAIVEREGRQI
jgi:hypothetical protein